MKNYYKLPKFIQWAVATLLFLVGLSAITPLAFNPLIGLILLPLLAPFLNLTTVPFFRLIGYYKYLNPYVLSTIQNDKEYDLHNIFTFDYLINFKWSDKGKHVQKTLLINYFKALNEVIFRIENQGLNSNVKIIGHSYFFNERTAERLGFTIHKAAPFWVINSCIQFIELSYLYSFSQGKWAIPKFWNVKRAEIIGSDLVKQKETIQLLIHKLEHN